MQASIESRVTIAADARSIFEYMSNPKCHQLWNPHLAKISASAHLKLGTQYETTSIMLGKTIESHNVVSEYVKDQKLTIENTTGILHYKVFYQLLPRVGDTQVRCKIRVVANGKAFAF